MAMARLRALRLDDDPSPSPRTADRTTQNSKLKKREVRYPGRRFAERGRGSGVFESRSESLGAEV